MLTQPTTTTTPLNGRTADLYQVVQRLDEAATSPDWRAEIAGAIAQLQALLADDDAPVWTVVARREAGYDDDPAEARAAGVFTVALNLTPITYQAAIQRRDLVLAGNDRNRLPYTVTIERAFAH